MLNRVLIIIASVLVAICIASLILTLMESTDDSPDGVGVAFCFLLGILPITTLAGLGIGLWAAFGLIKNPKLKIQPRGFDVKQSSHR